MNTKTTKELEEFLNFLTELESAEQTESAGVSQSLVNEEKVKALEILYKIFSNPFSTQKMKKLASLKIEQLLEN